jgi:hypothetical protein
MILEKKLTLLKKLNKILKNTKKSFKLIKFSLPQQKINSLTSFIF